MRRLGVRVLEVHNEVFKAKNLLISKYFRLAKEISKLETHVIVPQLDCSLMEAAMWVCNRLKDSSDRIKGESCLQFTNPALSLRINQRTQRV